MALDFRESYPIIKWDLNNRILTKYYCGSVDDSGNGYKVVILQDGSILTPTTEEVYFYFEKKDNTHGYIKSTIIDNYFVIDLTNQVFAVAGNVSCNFQITSGGRWKTSPEFIIKVDKNNIQDSIESSDDFIAFQEALNNLITVTDNAVTATNSAVTATNNATTATNTVIAHDETYTAHENERIAHENARPDWVKLTQAQFDALTTKDPNTFYEITDNDGQFPTNLQTLVEDVTSAKEAYDASVAAGSNTEVVAARTSSVSGTSYSLLKDRLDNNDQLLAQKASQSSMNTANSNIESLANTKMDKNGSGQVSYAMLAQDVRSAITGGNTAVVGIDAVLKDNITNNAVAPIKTDFVSEGKNKYNSQKESNGYLTSDGTIGTSATGWVTSDYIFVPINQKIICKSAYKFAAFRTDKVFLTGTFAEGASGGTLGDYAYTAAQNCYIRVSYVNTYQYKMVEYVASDITVSSAHEAYCLYIDKMAEATASKSGKMSATDKANLTQLLADIVNKADKTLLYNNLITAGNLVGIYPYPGMWATVDNGANETVCAAFTTGSYPYQRYRVNITNGHKYLFMVKVKGTTVTSLTMSLIVRYGDTTTALTNTKLSGWNDYVTKTAAFDYEKLACMVTMNTDTYSNLDFTISLTQPSKDTVWAYKEVLIVDITGLSDNAISELYNTAYFNGKVLQNVADRLTDAYKDKIKSEIASRWFGKNVLVIGESLTAVGIWQQKLSTLLGMNVTTRALGGIGLKELVDGYGALPQLLSADVSGKDLIIVFGGYNNRGIDEGVIGDVYPTNNTVAGQLQYVINTIYARLTTAANLTCKLAIITPHCAGKYATIPYDGYTEYPAGSGRTMKTLADKMQEIAEHNSLPCYNAWRNSGINKLTWNTYSASSTAMTGETVNDQLHLNTTVGYPHLGERIAAFVESI